MNDKSKSAAAGLATRPKIVIDATYRAKVGEFWELWTTKQGFESWWGPLRLPRRSPCSRGVLGGMLHYDMIADSPQGQRSLNCCSSKDFHMKSSLHPQLRRFMAMLSRPGCCFSSDKVKRFSHAKFSTHCLGCETHPRDK